MFVKPQQLSAMKASNASPSKRQRLGYAVATGAAFLAGEAFFGLMSYFYFRDSFTVFISAGWILFGALVSGGFLLSRYVMSQNSLALKIACIVLSPLTLSVMYIVGVITLIPYFIYNLSVLLSIWKYEDSEKISEMTRKAGTVTWIVLLSAAACALAGCLLYSAIQSNWIDQYIYQKTGYAPGTPDSAILRAYYYGKDDAGLSAQKGYDYSVQDAVLFVLAKRGSRIDTQIVFPGIGGTYRIKQNDMPISGGTGSQYVANVQSKYLTPDLDSLFTGATAVKNGNLCAIMLIIDARTDEEHWQGFLDNLQATFSGDTLKAFSSDQNRNFILSNIDRTYAEPLGLTLIDNKGEKIKKLSVNDGRYIIFCFTMPATDKDFHVQYSYKGASGLLLSNDDIRRLKIAD